MKQLVKRNIAIYVVVTLILLTVLLSGCTGYNKIMRDHFSNPDNYYELEIEVTRIYTYDGSKRYDECFTDIASSNDVDLDTADIFYINGKVLSGNYEPYDKDYYSRQHELDFEISQANVLHLLSTDFYDVVKVGDVLNVRSTIWTYWDREWYYVTEISLNGVKYLTFNEGLQNLIDYMNANKSLI